MSEDGKLYVLDLFDCVHTLEWDKLGAYCEY